MKIFIAYTTGLDEWEMPFTTLIKATLTEEEMNEFLKENEERREKFNVEYEIEFAKLEEADRSEETVANYHDFLENYQLKFFTDVEIKEMEV